MEVDSVEQRLRQPAEVTLSLSGRAHALLERRAATPARIGGGNELDASRKVADASDAGDGDPAILERLAKRLQRDYKNVHTDVTQLLRLGVLERQGDGVAVPWQLLRAELSL